MTRFIAMLIAAALTVGCGSKKADNQGRKASGAGRGAASSVAPPPEPLPKAGPDGLAIAFPKIVPVEPPQSAAGELAAMRKNWSDQDLESKPAARRELVFLLRKYQDKGREAMRLARYLISQESTPLVMGGISLLRTLHTDSMFVPVAASLMGHPSAEVRIAALSMVGYGLGSRQFTELLPFIRRLTRDSCCIVRRMALETVTQNRRKIARFPVADFEKGLDDECPAVRAYVMRHVDAWMPSLSGKGKAGENRHRNEIVDAFMRSAEKSPFYLEQCGALIGLGKMKVVKAEPLMAKALDNAAMPMMAVGCKGVKGPYTFRNNSSMPACAADALTALTGRRFPGRALAQVEAWKTELAKKHLTKPPTEGFCLSGRRCKDYCVNGKDCKADAEICLNLHCTPISEAADAYWRSLEMQHCLRRKSDRWSNALSDARTASGFALDMFGHTLVGEYLRKKDLKAYQAKRKAIESKPCPR